MHDGDGASSTLRLPHRRGSIVPARIALARLVRVVLVTGGLLGERPLDLWRRRVGRRFHGVLRLAHGQVASPGQPGAEPTRVEAPCRTVLSGVGYFRSVGFRLEAEPRRRALLPVVAPSARSGPNYSVRSRVR